MTDRLFKFGSFEDEIMKSMETTLVKYQKDQMYSHEKLAKAVDHLSAAAEIFDDTGFSKEAEALTKLIEKIAHDPSSGGSFDDRAFEESPTDIIHEDIDQEVGHLKHPINKSISEELNKSEIEELMESLKPKSEFDDMVGGLHEDPLAELKAAFTNFKKKVI
jgi:hypothetical protein